MNNPSLMPAAQREPLSVAATRTFSCDPAPRPLHAVIASELENLRWPAVVALSVFVLGISIGLVRWAQDPETVSAGRTTRFSPVQPVVSTLPRAPRMRGHALPQAPMRRFTGNWEEQRGADYEAGAPIALETPAPQAAPEGAVIPVDPSDGGQQQLAQEPAGPKLQAVTFSGNERSGGGGGVAPAPARQPASEAAPAAPVSGVAAVAPSSAPAKRQPAPRMTLARRFGVVETVKPAPDKASSYVAETAAPPDGSYKQPALDVIQTQRHMAYGHWEGKGAHVDPKATSFDAWPEPLRETFPKPTGWNNGRPDTPLMPNNDSRQGTTTTADAGRDTGGTGLRNVATR